MGDSISKGAFAICARLLVIFAAMCLSAGAARGEIVSQQQRHMGSDFRIQVYEPTPGASTEAVGAAFRRIAEIDDALSDYALDSELSLLLKRYTPGEPSPISDDFWHVALRSQHWSQRTGGAFDATVGPYVRLWRRARRQKELPSAERLQQARAASGYQRLQVDAKMPRLTLQVPGMRLDFGGIAKGYAVQQALDELTKRGFPSAIVDGGGDLAIGDPPPGRARWEIALAPRGDDSQTLIRLQLKNVAVATSGDSAQGVDIDGVHYSHILDPRSGQPLTGHSSVTVIAKSATDADALASAFSVLSIEDAKKLAASLEGVDVWLRREVQIDGKLQTVTWQSPGFATP